MDEDKLEQTFEKSVGEILKEAREKAELSISDIANAIHLTKAVIKDIESDDLDEKKSLTFNRGYIKLYARYIDLDESYVLSLFDKKMNINKEIALQSFSNKIKKDSVSNRFMLASYFSLFFILSLIVIFSISKRTNYIIEDTSITEYANEISINDEADNNIIDSQPLIIDTKDLEVVVIESDTDDLELDIKIDSNNILESNYEIIEETIALDADIDNLQANISQEPIEIITEDKNIELELIFNDECWIEIKNDDDKIILTGIKKSGDRVLLSDSKNYKLVLGNPEAVRVTYDEEIQNISKYYGRVARFKLPITI